MPSTLQNTALLNTPLATATALPTSTTSGILPELQTGLAQSSKAAALFTPTDLVTTVNENLVAILVDPGDTLGTARDLGSLSGTTRLGGWVGSTDTIDFYRLQLSGSHLNVDLTGLGADADLRLIRDVNSNGMIDYGEILSSSSRGSIYDETINLSGLSGGDYFVEVRRFSGDTSYTLRISDAYTNDLLGVETNLGDLTGTQVFSGRIDNNNTSDVYKFTASTVYNTNISLTGLSADADVRLIQDTNGNGIVDATDVVAGSYRGGSAAEKLNSAIPGWTYFVQVNQFSGTSDYHLGISAGDWFNTNLGDDEIMGEARYDYYNGGGIDRQEMIGLLRSAKDYGTIDGTELSDLRRIVANAGGLGMTDAVRVLGGKVVNSDPANARSGIGNLFSGSGSGQMDSLINKWFLGADRPTAGGTYRYTSGALFQNGISYSDVDQGAVGDCYFMASLGAVALKNPTAISNMFTDNGDGTFTVRFFNNGTADYVTVDRYLPTYNWGGFVYANDSSGMAYDDTRNELWVALAEKAYAQINESGWIGQDNVNTYAGIGGGWAKLPLEQIMGHTASANFINMDAMWNAFSAGSSVALHSNGSTEAGVVGNHVYVLTGFNYATGRYTLYNPWGGSDGPVELTRAQIVNNFSQWDAVV
jgi:Calpain family cysteine protease